MRSLQWTLFLALAALSSGHSLAFAAVLPLGQVQTGSISVPAQSNNYTFSANTNDMANFTMVTTSGNLVPKIQVYDPTGHLISVDNPGYCSGSRVEDNTVLLQATGTYTVIISDCSSTNTGSYNIYAQLTKNPVGATPLSFGQTQTGTISSAAQSNSYTLIANANDRLDFSMATTGGSLSPRILLYSPSGTLVNYANPGYCSGSTVEMNTVLLPTAGTYTVLLNDCSDTLTGNYSIYVQRTDVPTPATTLVLGQTVTGSISTVVVNNSYIVQGTANDRLDFTMVTTSGKLSPRIRLYNPDGTLLNYANPGYCSGSTTEMNTVLLPVTGTYSVLLGDCSDLNTGSYILYVQRTNNPPNPPGALPLPFGAVQTGSISSAALNNTYTFQATANDRMDFTMATTSGSLSPRMRLYNPDGTLLNYANPGYCSGSTVEMNTVLLPQTGTYTLLLGDCSDILTGNYAIYAQRTNDPAAPVALLYGMVESGTITQQTQSNSYIFQGSANDAVTFTMVTTTGALSPKMRLYNPDGTLLNYANPGYCAGSTVTMNATTLPQTGTYTALLGDCSDTKTGSYNISSQCFGACPAPVPTISSLSPVNTMAGGPAFTLTIAGTNFAFPATVNFGGAALTPVSLSATQLIVTVPASSILNAGPVVVTVTTAGGTSASSTFMVLPAPFQPTITGLSPNSVTARGPAFTLTVKGTNFNSPATVSFGGTVLTATVASSSQLTVSVPASLIAMSANISITVTTNAGTSAAANFSVLPPPVPATITYNYTGHDFVSGFFQAPYSTANSVNGAFTVASPLGNNLAAVDISSQVIAFSFTDGSVNTITNSNVIPGYRFIVSTNSEGNITAWDVSLILGSPPTNSAIFTCSGVAPCLSGPFDQSYLNNGAISGSVYSNPGTWTQTLIYMQGGPPSAPTPLPSGPPVLAVDGTISGQGAQQYYSFSWPGGAFSATASVMYASPGASYLFSGGTIGSCNSLGSATLSSTVAGTISIASLAAGEYCIGISANNSSAANFTITFNPPLAGPTPSCSLTLTPQSASLPATGTSTPETCPNNSGQPDCGVEPEIAASFGVTPSAGCGTWTATSSNPEFLQIVSWPSGSGNGTVSYMLLNNTHHAAENYTITVASGTTTASYEVTEAGSGDSQGYREVYALYEQLLGRDPDGPGFAFWIGTGAAGLGQMADSFLTSPEAFDSDFGVMATYQAATGNAPTFAQYNAAVTAMRVGTQTIGGLFNSLIGTGYSATNLYANLLGRVPGPADASCYASSLSQCFEMIIGYPQMATPIGSPNNEFQNTGVYHDAPDHSNALYVRMIYFVTLSRDPDPGGLAFWTSVANACGPGIYFQGSAAEACRLQILGPGTPNQGFIGSPEFQGLFAN